MNWYFTADLHLGHANIIKYCKRPFMNAEQAQLCEWIGKGLITQQELKIDQQTVKLMDQTIIDSINTTVDKNDSLVILGDFCMSRNKDVIQSYRNRIVCRNVYLVLGNHDDRSACSDLFTACYENYLFKIDGQYIFASHYPCRSWNKAGQGAWMLYGHVHNLYHDEDNGKMMQYDERIISEGFRSVFQKYEVPFVDSMLRELIEVCSSVKGMSLTLDVGVDNVRPGFRFGTPWSMAELRKYMLPKLCLWQARQKS